MMIICKINFKRGFTSIFILLCANCIKAQQKRQVNRVDIALRDSVFNHSLYQRKSVKEGTVGMRWSVADDKILVKVESYNTIIQNFDTTILLKPIFLFNADGTVGSVSDVLIFQNKLLKTLPIAEERKKKEHN